MYNKFDQMFSRLPATDQVLLEEDKPLYFLKAVDMKDRRALGTLLEDEARQNAYKREMNQRDVSEARQITSFKRVAANNIQRRVIDLQEGKTTWSEFEKAILAEFATEDLSRMTRHVLMKWIEKKNKNMSAPRV